MPYTGVGYDSTDVFFFNIIALCAFCVIGLAFGSFATALSYRIPRNIGWGLVSASLDKKVGKNRQAVRSQCVHCGYQLKALDLIPLFSWIFLKGQCRKCGKKISARYPLTELLACVLSVLIYLTQGLSVYAFFLLLLVPILVTLILVDIEHFLLPNTLVASVFGWGVVFLIYSMSSGQLSADVFLTKHVSGCLFYGSMSWCLGFLMTRILRKDALGFGDVKFFAAAGLWLGVEILPIFMILSGVFGIGLALLWRAVKKQKVFPFGPALILSFYILLIFNGSIFFQTQ